MLTILEGLSYWHWLGLGCLLLLVELVGTVGFVLWTGIAALIVGMVLLVFPISWQTQWLLFALQSLLTTWIWWRWQQKRYNSSTDAASDINKRMQGYIGRELILLDDVNQGVSRVRLGDTFWTVRCSEPLLAGAKVKVVDSDSHILIVIALS